MTKPALTLVEPDKSTLEIAAKERVESFRLNMIKMKRADGMSNQEIADECETSKYTIQQFLAGKRNVSILMALKISMGLGIEF